MANCLRLAANALRDSKASKAASDDGVVLTGDSAYAAGQKLGETCPAVGAYRLRVVAPRLHLHPSRPPPSRDPLPSFLTLRLLEPAIIQAPSHMQIISGRVMARTKG